MKIDGIDSMSVDDLWSLHDKLASILSRKLSEEKERLERRLLCERPESRSRLMANRTLARRAANLRRDVCQQHRETLF